MKITLIITFLFITFIGKAQIEESNAVISYDTIVEVSDADTIVFETTDSLSSFIQNNYINSFYDNYNQDYFFLWNDFSLTASVVYHDPMVVVKKQNRWVGYTFDIETIGSFDYDTIKMFNGHRTLQIMTSYNLMHHGNYPTMNTDVSEGGYVTLIDIEQNIYLGSFPIYSSYSMQYVWDDKDSIDEDLMDLDLTKFNDTTIEEAYDFKIENNKINFYLFPEDSENNEFLYGNKNSIPISKAPEFYYLYKSDEKKWVKKIPTH
jgi:hypothetical protein